MRDISLLKACGCIKGLTPAQLARLSAKAATLEQVKVFDFLKNEFGLKNRKIAAFIYYKVVERLTKRFGQMPHRLPEAERAKLKGVDRLGRLNEYKFREIAKYLS